ncbi:MAG: hypothetical protein KHW91_03090 [Clostridiales bacterium]|nr:hypothetical protein [Clostridiales bacterium]
MLEIHKEAPFLLHNKKAAAEADDLRKSSANFSGRQKDSTCFLKSFLTEVGGERAEKCR